MWQFDLHNKETNNNIPPFVPSEQNASPGGSIINLINSFCFCFSSSTPLSDYAMGGDVTFERKKTQRKSEPRCYFLSSVVLCIFLVFVCFEWKENLWCRFTPLPFRHQQPPLTLTGSHVDLCWIHCLCFFLMFGSGVLHATPPQNPPLFTHPLTDLRSSMAPYVIFCFSGPHRYRKKKTTLYRMLGDKQETVPFFCFRIALLSLLDQLCRIRLVE